MNIYDKFFALAKEKGLEQVELSYSKSNSLSISLYHHEIENFSIASDSDYAFRAIVNGKLGTATSTTLSNENLESIIDNLISNSKVNEKEEEVELFRGSEKYHKISTYNKDLENVPTEKKKEDLFALELAIEKLDKRIEQVSDVAYSESSSESVIMNSFGLKLKQKRNSFYFIGGVVMKGEDGEVKNNYDFFFSNDYSKFDVDKLAKKIVDGCAEQLGGEPIPSNKMKVVMSNDCTASLIGAYISHASAERVQKNVSLFKGKLGSKVASNKVTISDKPLAKTVFATWFDDEGVATYNKDIIKNGILQTYLYNIEKAKIDGVKTTGNGVNTGSKIGISPLFVELKPGKKTLDELFEFVGDGLYITELQGLHAGLNPTSGDFSLKAAGFLIEGGKRSKPVSLITVSGNLLQLFLDIKEVASDSKINLGGISCSSVYIKSLNIAGK